MVYLFKTFTFIYQEYEWLIITDHETEFSPQTINIQLILFQVIPYSSLVIHLKPDLFIYFFFKIVTKQFSFDS